MNIILLIALLLAPFDGLELDSLAVSQAASGARQTVEPSTRIAVVNRNGDVIVTGVDGSELSATAVRGVGGVEVPVEVTRSDAGILTVRPSEHAARGAVTLTVRVPKSAILGQVEAHSGDVTVSGIEDDLRILAASGDVRATGVGRVTIKAGSGSVVVDGASGAAFVDCGSGDVEVRGIGGDFTFSAGSGSVAIDNAGGKVDGTAASGDISVRGARGDVHVISISGNVSVENVTGFVQAETASGDVRVANATGDVEARTASGDAWMTGGIRAGGRYRVKSMSGDAVIEVCGDPAGFSATLSSYTGGIETDFELTIDRPNLVTRRLVGTYRDGSAHVEVEAFSGSARLLKCGLPGGR